MSQIKAKRRNVFDRVTKRFGVLTGRARFTKGIEYHIQVEVNQNGQELWLAGGQLEVLNEHGQPDPYVKIPACDRQHPQLLQQTGDVLEFDFVPYTLG